jgi:hypothetical protein
MRPIKIVCIIAIVVFSLFPVITPRTSVAQSPGGVELAVDTRNFTQDGLLVLFGGLRLQGDIGLPVAAGDINGDGRADVIYCGMFGSVFPRDNNGVVNIYISNGWDSGFINGATNPNLRKLFGERTGDLLGTSVSANGDVNGDGIRDVVVASALHDGPANDRFNAGAAYVVAGSPNFQLNTDLATLDGNPPPGVIAIYGPQVNGRMGIWCDEGDIDGDGFADIIIGSDQINSGAEQHVGGAHIVFGSPNLPSEIDLASPPPGVRTATILGQRNEEHWGAALQVGDINNDGIGDIIIGGSIFRDSASYVTPTDDSGHDARGAGDGGLRPGCGEVYVVYGQPNWPALIDLATPPATATRVIGALPGDLLGSQMHSGDINGDGRTDLIMGAIQATAPDNRGNTGAVHIVYGAPGIVGATIDLANPLASGLQVTTIFGEAAFDCAGDSVRTYDINRDGMSDLFIGSPEHSFVLDGETRFDAGDTKIIFGRSGFLPPVVKMYDPPPGIRMFRLAAANNFDEFSYRLSGGDVDGDGFIDYVSNAMHGDGFGNALENAGNVYIFSGRKLSARLGQLRPDQTPAPVLQSASLLSPQGQPIQQAPAGQSGLRIVVTGTGFRPDSEIRINGTPVTSQIPGDPGLAATQRTINLDDNLAIRNSAGPLAVRARNTQPSPSDLSNQLIAGSLIGPEIAQVKPKRKSSGILLLKVTGSNIPAGAGAQVTAHGTALELKSVSVSSSSSAQIKVRASSVPPAGTPISVRILGVGGIQSNEVTVAVP